MKLDPSDSSSDSIININSRHHVRTKYPQNNLRLPNEIKEELFKVIARKEAIRLLRNASLSEITIYPDPK